MKKLKILTGVPARPFRYWADAYPGPTFEKLGHHVVQDGIYKRGYDMAFITQNQRAGPRKCKDYPSGWWSLDSTVYIRASRKRAKVHDVMFVDVLDQVSTYKEFSHKAVYLPFACDPEIHKGVPAKEKFDIGYIGKGWEPRIDLLRALTKTGLRVYEYYVRRVKGIQGIEISKPLPWSEACKRYSQCKIIFNFSKDAGLNKRVYEGMSIGKLMLTNRKGSEPDNLFEDGKHLVVYDDEKDLVEKARYYSTHPEERRAIAKAGQELVHEKHKWVDRMQFVIETLLEKT